MKNYLFLLVLGGLLAGCHGTKKITETPTPAPVLATANDTLAYALGYDVGKSIQSMNLGIPEASVILGIHEAMSDSSARLSDEAVQEQIMLLQTRLRDAQMAKQKAEADALIAVEKAFLDENAKKEGVITTASGLQYKILREGEGASPKATDIVKVDYEGRLLDGTIFDSSYDRGEPIEFALNQVIPGWTEGVQLMKPGAKFELYLPSKLAYGDRGAPPTIGPGATLVFIVELLSFTSK